MEYINTYDEYRSLCKRIVKTGRLTTFADARRESSFIIVRHDIEFSVDKALRMAEIEASEGLQATYFVQIGNSSYNPFDDGNRAALRQIYEMGHDIGLHYRQAGAGIVMEEEAIRAQAAALRLVLDIPVLSFSCHRPRGDYNELEVRGMCNAYGPQFFEKTNHPEEAEVRYITDSKWRWNGDPEEIFSRDKVQFLTHPFQWSEQGDGMAETFTRLLEHGDRLLVQTFINEYQRFSEIRGAFE